MTKYRRDGLPEDDANGGTLSSPRQSSSRHQPHHKAHFTEIDRIKECSINGYKVYANRYEEQLSFEETEKIRLLLWNNYVSPEMTSIMEEMNPIFKTPSGTNSVAKVDWYRENIGRVVKDWKDRYPTFRYIDGYFYCFHMTGPALCDYDMFDFERWKPECFDLQVQRWIEEDLKIVKELRRKLNIMNTVSIILATVLAFTTLYLLA